VIWYALYIFLQYNIALHLSGTSALNLYYCPLLFQALSSSIGSNIFDILVGLPIPWLLYTAIYSTTISVSCTFGIPCSKASSCDTNEALTNLLIDILYLRLQITSDNLWIYIFALLGMLIFIVAVIHCQGWQMTKALAVLMLLFYFGFLVMAILLERPFKVCSANGN